MGLSDKMEYIGGVLPRGIIAQTVKYYRESPYGQFDKTLVEVSGSGYLFSASIYLWAAHNYSVYNLMTITIDGSKIINVGTGTHVNSDNGAYEKSASLKVDLESITPNVKNDSFPITCAPGTDYVTNKLIRFEKSLKITCKYYSGSNANSSGSVCYALD